MASTGRILGSIGGFFLGGPAGASLGGTLGGALDGNEETNGGAGATSQTRDPWAAAQPYMRDNLKKNANLQQFYEQNPFNAQQKTGYQNQNNTIDQFNGKVAPGLLDFANQMMGSGYQRQHGPVGSAGYSQAPQEPSGGLLGGPFSMPQQQSFGQIDWNAMNPHSAQNKPTTMPSVNQTQDNFNPVAYLEANPDVKADPWASTHPWEHYNGWGKDEGRKFTGRG